MGFFSKFLQFLYIRGGGEEGGFFCWLWVLLLFVGFFVGALFVLFVFPPWSVDSYWFSFKLPTTFNYLLMAFTSLMCFYRTFPLYFFALVYYTTESGVSVLLSHCVVQNRHIHNDLCWQGAISLQNPKFCATFDKASSKHTVMLMYPSLPLLMK